MATKVYITFGQIHAHAIPAGTMDKDCIAVINAAHYAEGRGLAFDWFDGEFHHCYSQEEWDKEGEAILPYYPRGLIEVNPI